MKRIFVFLLIILLGFFGCVIDVSEDEEEPEEEEPNVTVPDDTKVVSDFVETVMSDHIYFSEDVGLEVGDIIIAGICDAASNGFIKRVTSVSSDGETAWIEDAAIEDAVKSCEVFFTTSISSARSYRGLEPIDIDGYTYGVKFDSIIFYDHDGLYYTTNDQIVANGELGFNIYINSRLKIENHVIQELSVATIIDQYSEIQISCGVDASINEKTWIGGARSSPFILGYISFVPVVAVIDIDMYIGIDGEVSVGASVAVSQNAGLEAGIEYISSANPKWAPVFDNDSSFEFEAPSFFAELNMKPYASVEIGIQLYGVAGPFIGVSAYLEGVAQLRQSEINWELWAGLDMFGGAEIEILGRSLTRYDSPHVNIYERMLTSYGEIVEDPEESSGNRFTNMGNGTVKDNETGLIWAENANIPFNDSTSGEEYRADWQIAMDHVGSLNSGEHGLSDGSSEGDWRLPTISEWGDFIDTSYIAPALCNASGDGIWREGDAFVNVLWVSPSESYYTIFWTSSEIDSNDVYVLDLYDGDGLQRSKDAIWRIWPVRNARPGE